MITITQAITGIPNTVSGVNPTTYLPGSNGITAGPQPVKLFSPVLNAPGSLRLDGEDNIVRASGNIVGGVATNTQLSLYLNYPTLSTGSAQYPLANISAATTVNTGGTGYALFNANNNFVIGQYVSVANVNAQYNAIIGPLSVANSTAFGGFINGAAAVNASTGATVNTSTIGFASMLPQPLYTGLNTVTILNVGATVPWSGEIHIRGDQGSGVVFAYGFDGVVNYNANLTTATQVYQAQQNVGTGLAVPGVNFKNEPAFTLSVGETFGASNASNSATLKSFFLEQ